MSNLSVRARVRGVDVQAGRTPSAGARTCLPRCAEVGAVVGTAAPLSIGVRPGQVTGHEPGSALGGAGIGRTPHTDPPECAHGWKLLVNHHNRSQQLG